MKKLFTLLSLIGLSLMTYAEMRLWKNGVYYVSELDSITFVDTEPSVDPQSVVNVAPETLVMSVGQTERLSVTVSPAPATAVTFIWTSDNESVASVKNGIVTAVAPGTANIVVSVEGYTPDTCLVNVTNDAALDNYQLLSYGLFGSPEMIPGTERDIELNVGTCPCQLGYITMYAWDNNVSYVNGTGFGGAGYFITAEVPVYWIIEGQYKGSWVGNKDGFHIAPNPQDTIAPYTALSGELTDLQSYGDFWKALIDPATEELTQEIVDLYLNSQVGTRIFHMDFEEESESWNLGNVTAAHLYENENDELQYEITLDWYDFVNDNRLYGLLCNVNETTGVVESIVEPYDMRFISKTYTNVVAEEKPAKRNAQAKTGYTIGGKAQNNTVAIEQVRKAIRAAIKK